MLLTVMPCFYLLASSGLLHIVGIFKSLAPLTSKIGLCPTTWTDSTMVLNTDSGVELDLAKVVIGGNGKKIDSMNMPDFCPCHPEVQPLPTHWRSQWWEPRKCWQRRMETPQKTLCKRLTSPLETKAEALHPRMSKPLSLAGHWKKTPSKRAPFIHSIRTFNQHLLNH